MADPYRRQAARNFRHVTDWVFDLDNTLYPGVHVFPEIDRRMTGFVADYLQIDKSAALALQKRYYAEHGTTLLGMMERHAMPPADFLAHVHEVDLSPVPRCAQLRDGLAALPGRKFIYTNGSRRHAERVTRHLGLDHLFDGMSGIECTGYVPKPDPHAYDRFCDRHAVSPTESVFFEDLSRNLVPAHALGFPTVLVRTGGDWSHEPPAARPGALGADRTGGAPGQPGDDPDAHVHYVTEDLAGFLMAAHAKTEDETP